MTWVFKWVWGTTQSVRPAELGITPEKEMASWEYRGLNVVIESDDLVIGQEADSPEKLLILWRE